MMRRFSCRSATILPSLLTVALLTSPSRGQTTEGTSPPVSPVTAGTTVELAYAPEDGSMYEVTETFERVTAAAGQDAITDTRERVSRVLITCTDEGYTNTVTVVSQKLLRNGHEVASPVNAAMTNLTLTYNLAKDGTIAGVAGYEQLPEAMKSRFAAQVAATMTRMLNISSLQQRDEQAYRALYDGLIGSSVTIGETSASAMAQPLPYGGSAVLYSVSTSESEADGPLVLRRAFSTDAEALAGEFESVEALALQAAASGAMLAADLPADHQSASVSGTAETVIDPTGLLVGHQRVTMAYTLAMNNPAGESPNVVEITDSTVFATSELEPEMTAEQAPQQ